MGLEEKRDVFAEIEPSYRKLESVLKGREGEQILVINENIYSQGCDHSYHEWITSSLRLGVLTSDRLRFETGDGEGYYDGRLQTSEEGNLQGPRIILPTKKYAAEIYRRCSPQEWELIEREIQISYLEFDVGFEPDGKRTPLSRRISIVGVPVSGTPIPSSTRLLIKVGIEDVVECFKSDASLYHDDFSYVRALDLLGIKDQAPTDFLIKYNEEVGEAKGHIVKGLIELLEEQGLSKSRIKSIYNIAERGGVISEGGAITPVGDKDDARVISMGARQKLNETGRNIVRKLEAAVKLGMHNENLVLDGEIPGQSFDAQILIRTLCDKYEVPYN